ncbi:arylsulfatase [Hydrogenophaga sp.]|uniref:arylsulfatase n=1 Tax=Hydrogenophaga sp. TaxID=1904254 RepID=UPI00260DE109|nr:arylsulfatase [Hydrogenophaga sp.]MCW5654429.1 arylsulfatase [Hydrogenophaga sp.]
MSSTQRPAWPQRKKAREGAPNVIVFLTDDVGYGACSTFGGPIDTPHLDRLAERGLRFTQFHTTAMCSPTRGALLTGRNPHRVSMGRITNRPTYYDGYTSVIPKSAGTVADILRQAGYTTAMFGKGHITPEWEMSPLGPFDRWPTGLGFDYFYGFLGYDTNMWAPNLVENTSYIEPPHEDPPRHFDELMAERAADWMAQQRTLSPEKPFFVYYATGTAHTPHHAPPKWLQKYRGRFDQGWDAVRSQTFERQKKMGVIPSDAELTARPDDLPAWDSLSDGQRILAARLMEAYAAALDHLDHQVGRLVASLEESGELDNTLIMFIQGDNGGSAEGGFNGLLFEQSWTNGFDEELEEQLQHLDEIGGPAAYNHFPAAWGWAINSPFKYYKQVASHFGGTRNGLVVSWPKGIREAGAIRSQFHFVSDILPTVLEAAGAVLPESINGVPQDPIDGVSMMYAMSDGGAPSRRKTQVFECLENFGVYHDGWFASTTPANNPWDSLSTRKPTQPDQRDWELYDVQRDYSQAHDLAQAEPAKLAEMQALFWRLAEENKILPIHPPTVAFEGRPSIAAARTSFTYRRRVRRVHSDAAPHTVGRSFSIECEVVVGPHGGQGVIVSHGSNVNGYAFYLQEGVPTFYYNAIAPHHCKVAAASPLSSGRHHLKVEVLLDEHKPASGARIVLQVDGAEVAQGRLQRTLRTFINQDSFNIGADSISPVSPDYGITSSEFDGELPRVQIELKA